LSATHPNSLSRVDDRNRPIPGPDARNLTASGERLITAPRLVTGVLAGSITLVRIASTFGHKTLTISVVMLIFMACVLWALPQQRHNVLLSPSAGLVFLFGVCVSIALLRGAQDGSYGNLVSATGKIVLYLPVIALGIVGVSSARNAKEREHRVLAIVLAPVVYAAVNAVLGFAGVQNPNPTGAATGTQDQLLGLLGFTGGREIFPLTTSINLYSIVASASVAGLIVLRLRAPESLPRVIAWPAVIICLYEVIAGDSRATLAFAAAVVLVFLLRRRFANASGIGLLIPAFPLIVIAALGVLANTSLGDLLSRSNGGFGSLATGTGRLYIWRGTWQVLSHFQLQDLIGWGAAGQIASGASLHYAFVFPNTPLAYTVFTHNEVLQTILDQGYIGLVVLVALVWQTFRLLARHIRREPRSPAIALVAMLLVIVLSGATEVSPSYYAEEVLIMTFLIAGAAAALAAKPPGTREGQSDAI
jgi:O-antigen ligase